MIWLILHCMIVAVHDLLGTRSKGNCSWFWSLVLVLVGRQRKWKGCSGSTVSDTAARIVFYGVIMVVVVYVSVATGREEM